MTHSLWDPAAHLRQNSDIPEFTQIQIPQPQKLEFSRTPVTILPDGDSECLSYNTAFVVDFQFLMVLQNSEND